MLHVVGVDVEGWLASLWDALTAVDPEYVALGLGLQTLETLLSAIAWLAILRAAYPQAGIEALPIVTTYAVAGRERRAAGELRHARDAGGDHPGGNVPGRRYASSSLSAIRKPLPG